MRIKDNDAAIIYRIHVGLMRDGKAFLDSDTLENVLGDIPHKECLSIFMRLVQDITKEFLDHHFGEEIPHEQAEAALKDDVMDFFDRHRDISDEQ